MVAKIADDLKKALLVDGAFQKAGGDAAEEALAGEFENGIVFAGGPVEVAGLGAIGERFVTTGERAHVEPRENHVDRKIGNALFAEERLRTGKTGGLESPMIAPEFIVPNLKDFGE